MPTASPGAAQGASRGRVSTNGAPQRCFCPQCTGIVWRDVVRVAPQILTGMTEAEAKKASRAERPMVVYVYPTADEDDEVDLRLAIQEDPVFRDPRVRLACKFFAFLRIDRDSAALDRTLKRHAAKLRRPALVLVRPTFEAVSVVPAKCSATKLYRAMCGTVAKDYRNDVNEAFRKERALRAEWDGIWRDQDKLDRLDRKLADLNNEVRRERLEKKRAELSEAIDAQREKLLARERQLYVLTPKPVS
jgi:hypothetical protein